MFFVIQFDSFIFIKVKQHLYLFQDKRTNLNWIKFVYSW